MDHPSRRTGLSINAGVLYGIARQAYDRIPADGTDVDSDAVISLVFAAASLEAFVNELVLLANIGDEDYPPAVRTFAQMVAEIEETRGTTRLKYIATWWAFQGTPINFGSQPFQDFGDLFAVRDQVMHYKGEEFEFDAQGRTIEATGKHLLSRLQNRGILADFNPRAYVNSAPSWLSRLRTRAAAEWACDVASRVVAAILDAIPESELRRSANFFYRSNFGIQGPDV